MRLATRKVRGGARRDCARGARFEGLRLSFSSGPVRLRRELQTEWGAHRRAVDRESETAADRESETVADRGVSSPRAGRGRREVRVHRSGVLILLLVAQRDRGTVKMEIRSFR